MSLGLSSQDYNLAEAQTAMNSAEAAIEEYKNSKVLEYQQAISELNVKITKLMLADSSSQGTAEQLRSGTVSAEKEGVINVVSTVVTGDILSAGSPLAMIIPPNESEYKVQIPSATAISAV